MLRAVVAMFFAGGLLAPAIHAAIRALRSMGPAFRLGT